MCHSVDLEEMMAKRVVGMAVILLAVGGCGRAQKVPTEAKTLACPAGEAIELSGETWVLGGDCAVSGVSLRADAQLWAEGRAFTVAGNVKLEDGAGLHVVGGVFTVANHFKFQYRIEAKGKSVLDIRGAKVSTNAGEMANLTTNYVGSDDSLLHIEDVETDKQTSWLLANLKGRARLETKDSPHFPGEIYPSEQATVRIEGPKSAHQVWLKFTAGTFAVLDGLPDDKPFSFSFGRNTPGVVGVGYEVDVVNGSTGFSITSRPGSNVTVKNSHVGVGLEFADVTVPETVSGLKGGLQSGQHHSESRVMDLENATLPPYGWQVYSSNGGIDSDKAKPVTIRDSLINEMGAAERGWFEAEHVQFAFAAVAAQGPGSRVHIRDSVLNSHTVMANNDGVMTIEGSEIYGSRVQAIGRSRILLLNTTLLTNVPNAKCLPVFPSLDGKARTKCNPYNPSTEVQFVTQGDGVIEVARIDEMKAPLRFGEPITFVGDALVKGASASNWTYTLSYKRPLEANYKEIVSGVAADKRGEALGTLAAGRLRGGEYLLQLELIEAGHDPVTVRRRFWVDEGAPYSGH